MKCTFLISYHLGLEIITMFYFLLRPLGRDKSCMFVFLWEYCCFSSILDIKDLRLHRTSESICRHTLTYNFYKIRQLLLCFSSLPKSNSKAGSCEQEYRGPLSKYPDEVSASEEGILSGQDKMGGPDMSYRNFQNQTR